jgi:hypothetical protein
MHRLARSALLAFLIVSTTLLTTASADEKDKGKKGTVTTRAYSTGCVQATNAWVFCPDGYVATGGGAQSCNTLKGLIDTLPVVRDPQTGDPLTPANGETPNGWFAENLSNAPEQIAVWVVCAPGP